MDTMYISALAIFGFDYAPKLWAFCDGQLLAIQQNQALFSLLGTTFGGNGTTTFALPNLKGRVPIGMSQGPGLSNYVLGQQGGNENVTLQIANLPAHSHTAIVNNTAANGASPATASAIAAVTDVNTEATKIYNTATPNVTLNSGTITPIGGSQPHSNLQPYITVNYCICLSGNFPSRN
jgi:microcystin-dependent protein